MQRLCTVLFMLMSAGVLFAQDEVNPEQLKGMYADALSKLRVSQDRRNELARENEKLAAKVAELTKAAEQCKQEVQTLSDKTFQARSEYAAFQEFLKRNPAIQVRWDIFMKRNLLSAPPETSDLLDPQWPMSAK